MNFSVDENKLIVQTDGDGGDTAGREGDYWFYIGLNGGIGSIPETQLTFKDVLKLLQVSPGVFIRNPRHNPVTPPDKSWDDPTDFSRDQSIPIILALGENKEYDVLKAMMKQQIKRFGFFQNKDWASPEDVGTYIRAFKAWYLYPLLLVGDCFMLGESVVRLFAKDGDVSDDINHTLILLQAQRHFPTPISWLARKIYKWFRKGGVQGAWDVYFDPRTRANDFYDLYRSLIDKM